MRKQDQVEGLAGQVLKKVGAKGLPCEITITFGRYQ